MPFLKRTDGLNSNNGNMKYLVVSFAILFGCNGSKTKITEPAPKVISERADTIKTTQVIKEARVDSAHINQINLLVDSILHHRGFYDLIIRERIDGDCQGRDSLYYDNNNQLVIYLGSAGCSADESFHKSVYNSTGLIYSNFKDGWDGLVFKDDVVYYKKSVPFFGYRKNYEWDGESRTLEGSSSRTLSNEELKKIAKRRNGEDDKVGHVMERVKELKPMRGYANKIKLADTIQQIYEWENYYIDSIVYVDIIK